MNPDALARRGLIADPSDMHTFGICNMICEVSYLSIYHNGKANTKKAKLVKGVSPNYSIYKKTHTKKPTIYTENTKR